MEILRSTSGNPGTWSRVVTGGNGTPANVNCAGFQAFDGYLYTSVENHDTGAQIWRSTDGATWEAVATGGLGMRLTSKQGDHGFQRLPLCEHAQRHGRRADLAFCKRNGLGARRCARLRGQQQRYTRRTDHVGGQLTRSRATLSPASRRGARRTGRIGRKSTRTVSVIAATRSRSGRAGWLSTTGVCLWERVT